MFPTPKAVAGAAAAVLVLLSPAAAAAQGGAPGYPVGGQAGRTIRFPLYDPRLGSLEAYREALVAAVDAHVAHIRSGEAVAEVSPAVVFAPPRPVARPNPIGALAPATEGRGVMNGSVGVSVPGPATASRQAPGPRP
jgi:hypothetical protein